MVSIFRRVMVAAALLAATAAFAATKEDIQADMRAGRWQHADELLQQVIAKHPNNALAHYWRAEVQAKLGNIANARHELAEADRIDPSAQFASNPRVLSDLRQKVAVVPPVPAEPAAVTSAPTAMAVPPPLRVPEASTHQASTSEPEPASWVKVALWAGVIGAALVMAWQLVRRKAEAVRLQEEREHAAAALRDAKKELDDAISWSDGQPELAPEAKLGNFDRARGAKLAIDGATASLPSSRSFDEAYATALRARDIAAEIRGKETPSQAQARQRDEAAQREHELRIARAQAPVAYAAAGPSTVIVDHGSSGDGFLTGMLVGNMMHSGSSSHNSAGSSFRARDDDDDEDRRRPKSTAWGGGADIDVGGTSAGGDASFDTGGPSGGGPDTSFD